MKQVVYKFLFFIYVMLLVFITYINNGVNNVGGLKYHEAVISCINLVPFYGTTVKQCLISFVQFMPLGYFLIKLFPQLTNKLFIITSLSIITLFKLIRLLLLVGYFDLTNILCGFLGSYLIYQSIKNIC